MSEPRYRWWSFVRRIIRAYPELKAEWEELHRQPLFSGMSAIPGGGGSGRKVETIALRTMQADDQKDYDAVTKAIMVTKLREDGEERIAMIRYMYWHKKEHRLKDAAPRVHVAEATAKRWHGDFVRLVAKYRGFTLDDTAEPE